MTHCQQSYLAVYIFLYIFFKHAILSAFFDTFSVAFFFFDAWRSVSSFLAYLLYLKYFLKKGVKCFYVYNVLLLMFSVY